MRPSLLCAPLALLVCVSLGDADLVVPRPYGREERVAPLSTRSYLAEFKTDEPAKVQLSGGGNSSLGLYVFDAHGNCLKWDDLTTPRACDELLLEWIPSAGGRCAVAVHNGGLDVNEYTLAMR
jgi:hypothetical protein